MKREQLSAIICSIDERHIAEAYQFDPGLCARSSERIVRMKKKRVFALALAAALILALGVGAYAAYFSMNRRVPDAAETFRINWEENPNGYLEWHDAKLAVTFPETAQSREIEFRPGWLPEELASLKSDAWLGRLTAETLSDKYPDMTANQPMLIETYYMSMFNDGGALLLLYYSPENIIEEHWDEQGVDVMRFHCTQRLEARAEFNVPERTLEEDIILMSNPDAGWVVRLAGEAGMDTLVRTAKNLEIRQTGRTFTYNDFEDHYAFMDGGVG